MMLLRISASVLVAALAVGCSSNTVKEEPPAVLTSFSAEADVRVAWSMSLGSMSGDDRARLDAVLYAGVLYAANADGRVRAIVTETGKTKWDVELRVPVSAPTGAGEGLVLVGTRKGEVLALDADSGELRWRARVSGAVRARPTASVGVVVVQSVDGRLTGLDALNGQRRWISDRAEPALSLHGSASPVMAEGFVVTGFASGKLVIARLADGKTIWEHPVAIPRGRDDVERLVDIDASPVLAGEMLYAVAYQGKVVAINMREGREAWSRDLSSHVDMDVDDTALFVADDRGQVHAIGRSAGASMWVQDKLRGRRLGAVAAQAGAVAVGDFDGYVHFLAPDDGRFIARYRLASEPVTARAIVDGERLYVVSQGGQLAALELQRR